MLEIVGDKTEAGRETAEQFVGRDFRKHHKAS